MRRFEVDRADTSQGGVEFNDSQGTLTFLLLVMSSSLPFKKQQGEHARDASLTEGCAMHHQPWTLFPAER